MGWNFRQAWKPCKLRWQSSYVQGSTLLGVSFRWSQKLKGFELFSEVCVYLITRRIVMIQKIENRLNPGVPYFDRTRSSGWKQSSEGLLVVTEVSTSWWAKVTFRGKRRLEIQMNLIMLWTVLVAGRIIWLVLRMLSDDWWLISNCHLTLKMSFKRQSLERLLLRTPGAFQESYLWYLSLLLLLLLLVLLLLLQPLFHLLIFFISCK